MHLSHLGEPPCTRGENKCVADEKMMEDWFHQDKVDLIRKGRVFERSKILVDDTSPHGSYNICEVSEAAVPLSQYNDVTYSHFFTRSFKLMPPLKEASGVTIYYAVLFNKHGKVKECSFTCNMPRNLQEPAFSKLDLKYKDMYLWSRLF